MALRLRWFKQNKTKIKSNLVQGFFLSLRFMRLFSSSILFFSFFIRQFCCRIGTSIIMAAYPFETNAKQNSTAKLSGKHHHFMVSYQRSTCVKSNVIRWLCHNGIEKRWLHNKHAIDKSTRINSEKEMKRKTKKTYSRCCVQHIWWHVYKLVIHKGIWKKFNRQKNKWHEFTLRQTYDKKESTRGCAGVPILCTARWIFLYFYQEILV